ncbi:uncharacterized protein BT62DRAFT_983244 [Guyanagaster necrorhizus]|uniref:SWIM-type domain-containing protein n=1 Tax=Guyanagaster necrorhizus TaxID=856835 RepID=A0A9P8ALD3_9AGAR|nr:uncharacterized protein BT62DRAFT_983244 [Guyanagaster necrorhizus MCA 3950]KAG7440088.1 hypothetical protein BT62DRAFT_983244 [Guyanagaster necrorhizus MCA 3950]
MKIQWHIKTINLEHNHGPLVAPGSILQLLLTTIIDSPPEIFISDRDRALISAIAKVLPLILHVYCLHHLKGNIVQKLWPILGGDWKNFQTNFWKVYRADEIYITVFTCGVYTNGHIKPLESLRTSLKQLFNTLCKHTEAQSEQNNTHVHELSQYQKDKPIESIFLKPLQILHEHIVPYALHMCFKQMELSIIIHLLHIQHLGRTDATHYLAVLSDGKHICNCYMLLNLGIPCWHFFQALATCIWGLYFSIGLICA